MGILNLTALPGPVSARVLPFVVQISTSSMLLATLAAAAIGILWAAVRAIRRQRVRPVQVAPLRLVVPARPGR